MKPTGQKNIIEIGPSRSLGLFLCSTHLTALIVLVYFALQFPLCIVLVPPLLWNWSRSWSMLVVQTADTAVTRVEWGRDEAWTLIDRQGRQSVVRLLERNFVAPWMTLLSFSCESCYFRRHVILLGDNSDTDQVRRLRVRLRLNWP